MNSIFLLFIILVIIGIKTNYSKENKDYYDKDYFLYLRGLCAICVVSHHISICLQIQSGLFQMFKYMGNLCVAVFFTISGFGCAMKVKSQYTEINFNFLKKRFLMLFVPYCEVSLIQALVCMFEAGKVDYCKMLFGWSYGQPFVYYSWYVFAVMYFYCVFYITKKYFSCAVEPMLGVFSVLYIILFAMLGYGENTIYTAFCFLLGCIIAKNRKEIETLSLRKYIWVCCLCVVLFVVGIICSNKITGVAEILLYNVSMVAFSTVCLEIGRIVQIRNTLWKKLGIISYEIYLLHGVFIRFFRTEICYINSDVLYFGCVILCTVTLSAAVHKINKSWLH